MHGALTDLEVDVVDAAALQSRAVDWRSGISERPKVANFNAPAAVVKLVYTRRSGRRALTGVEVRILSAASKRRRR
jgi:hypothetical protein